MGRQRLLDAFRNPPKGGNREGAKARNQDLAPQMGSNGEIADGSTHTLREVFNAGTRAARANVLRSGRVGETDLRNFDRGRVLPQPMQPGETADTYDYESASDGRARVNPNQRAPEQGAVRVEPTLNPPNGGSRRGDGRPA